MNKAPPSPIGIERGRGARGAILGKRIHPKQRLQK